MTNAGISSARLYWERLNSGGFDFFNVKGVSIPVAVSAFPDELYQAPRSWAEPAYPKLIHYNKLDKGGHFAASRSSSSKRFVRASGCCANRTDDGGARRHARAVNRSLLYYENAPTCSAPPRRE